MPCSTHPQQFCLAISATTTPSQTPAGHLTPRKVKASILERTASAHEPSATFSVHRRPLEYYRGSPKTLRGALRSPNSAALLSAAYCCRQTLTFGGEHEAECRWKALPPLVCASVKSAGSHPTSSTNRTLDPVARICPSLRSSHPACHEHRSRSRGRHHHLRG